MGQNNDAKKPTVKKLQRSRTCILNINNKNKPRLYILTNQMNYRHKKLENALTQMSPLNVFLHIFQAIYIYRSSEMQCDYEKIE